MLLGEVFKNINKKYKNIYFKNIRFNSKECKPNDIFLLFRETILTAINIFMMQ